MRVGLDARYLSASPAGIGRYSRALMEAMFRQAPDVEWVVLVHASLAETWPADPPARLEVHRSDHRPVSRFSVGGLGRWIHEQRVDLWHAMFPIAPRCGVPLVTTVHDLQPLLCPGWNGKRPWPLPWTYRRFYRWAYGRTVNQARRVIAISQWTAKSVGELWPEAANRVAVIPYGLEAHWGDSAPEKDPDVPALVYPGSTRPNKNLPNLVEAFSRLIRREDVPPDLRLRLIVVRDRFWEDVARRIEACGVGDRVDVLEPQGDEELAREYRRAAALAFVTTHEGFGLPPIEAMACGCPVIAARHGALPETCGDAAELVDPHDPEAITAGFARVLSDPAHRQALVERGRDWVKRWSWERAADQTLQIYRETAAG